MTLDKSLYFVELWVALSIEQAFRIHGDNAFLGFHFLLLIMDIDNSVVIAAMEGGESGRGNKGINGNGKINK